MARRDKSAVKILCIFKGEAIQPTRINNIKDLNFPSSLETRISNVFHPNRLLWEVWLESASDTAELRKNLMKRGYKDLPIANRPVCSIQPTEGIDIIIPNFKKIEVKKEIMLQKNH